MSIEQREPKITFSESMPEPAYPMYSNFPVAHMFQNHFEDNFAFSHGGNDASISDSLFQLDDVLDYSGGDQNPVDATTSGAV